MPEARRIAFWSLLGIAVAVPLAMSNLTVLGFAETLTINVFDTPKLLFLGLCLAIGLSAWAFSLARDGGGVYVARSSIAAAVFFGLAALSTVFAVNKPAAVFGDQAYQRGLMTLLMCAAVYLLAIQLIRSSERLRTLTWFSVGAGTAVALYGLLQVTGNDPFSWPGIQPWMLARGISTLGNPDFLGGYLVMPLALALGLAASAASTRERVLAALAACAIAAGVALSLTRAAWGAALVVVLVFAVVWLRAAVGKRAVSLAILGGVLAVGAAAVFAISSRVAMSRFAKIFEFGPDFGDGRLYFWREAVAMIGSRPVLGAGPDSFRLLWYAFRTPEEIVYTGYSSFNPDPHNGLLSVAATLGIPALLALLTLMAMVLWDARSAIVSPAKVPGGFIVAGWWTAVVGYGVYLIFGVETVATAVVLWMALGVLTAPRARILIAESAGWRMGVATASGLFASAFLLFGTLNYASSASLMASHAAPLVKLPAAERAVALAPWSFEAREWAAHVRANQVLAQAGNPSDPNLPTAYASVAEAYQAVIDFSPRDDFGTAAFAAWLNQMAPAVGDRASDRAISVGQAALEYYPLGVSVAAQKAVAHYNLNEYEAAVETLEPVWRLAPEDPQVARLYLQALVAAKDSRAQQVFDQLKQQYPDDKDILATGQKLTAGGGD